MRVGLTGGIGAGKSAVAKLFEEFGALIVDTDLLAREAAAPGSPGLTEIARLWPAAVRAGALDRAALAAIVFADPAARARLNGLLHPEIRRLAFAREAAAVPGQPIVHVVPLLFETGYDRLVDASVLVTAPEAQRIARIRSRDALGESAARARIAAQIAPEAARERADYLIENDGDLATLRARTRAVYERLTAAEAGPQTRAPRGEQAATPFLGDS